MTLAAAIEEAKLRIDYAESDLRHYEKHPENDISGGSKRAESEILCLRIFLQVAESISRKHSNAS